MVIAVSAEVGDDLGRGLWAQHGSLEGIEDARQVVAFEAAHGFWIEPAWQLFFQQTHRILSLTITWGDAVSVMNAIYVFGHVFVTLAVALWVYFYRRRFFPLFRNMFILTNAFALVVYERYPVAPPRLAGPLLFDHHLFTFQDTVFGIVSASGKLLGTRAGYNEFSALPSVHIAWALIVSATLLWLAQPLLVKALAVLYPGMMLVAVVVTGNHFLLDAVASVFVVLAAALVAGGFERWRSRRVGRRGGWVERGRSMVRFAHRRQEKYRP
jgi:hypothetical protein